MRGPKRVIVGGVVVAALVGVALSANVAQAVSAADKRSIAIGRVRTAGSRCGKTPATATPTSTERGSTRTARSSTRTAS